MTYSSYELKYCERCGGLGLRRRESAFPYCCDCEQMMRNFWPRPAASAKSTGQLRRILQSVEQRVPPSSAGILGAQEAVHVS
jgi:hypothetical protein